MPTLLLYDPAPPHPDGWHRVTAPGGYETWRFDAEDEAADLRVMASFSLGSPYDDDYQRRAAAFLRNPTRLPPPQPADFPAVVFAVYEKGERLTWLAERHRPDAFEASSERPEVRIGANRLLSNASGTLSVSVSSPRARLARGRSEQLAAELWFTSQWPGAAPVELTWPSRGAGGADHRWIVAAPLCTVTGTVRLGGSAEREIRFNGRGYHDHDYGSGPVCRGMRWLIGGRVLEPARAVCFRFAMPSEPGRSVEAHVVEASPAGVRCDDGVSAVGVMGGWPSPSKITLGGAPGLVFRDPVLLERWTQSRWAEYRVGKEQTGLAEIVSPRRNFLLPGPALRVLPLGDEFEPTDE